MGSALPAGSESSGWPASGRDFHVPVPEDAIPDDQLEFIAWQNLPPEERWRQSTNLLRWYLMVKTDDGERAARSVLENPDRPE